MTGRAMEGTGLCPQKLSTGGAAGADDRGMGRRLKEEKAKGRGRCLMLGGNSATIPQAPYAAGGPGTIKRGIVGRSPSFFGSRHRADGRPRSLVVCPARLMTGPGAIFRPRAIGAPAART